MARILLSHGAGGREMATLIDEVFLARYGDPNRVGDDSATVLVGSHRLAFTTDSFVVDPLFFPGGDIGRLAVAGTVNDLLTAAARPLVLSASFILEEGLEIDDLADHCRVHARHRGGSRGPHRHRGHQGGAQGLRGQGLHHHRRGGAGFAPRGVGRRRPARATRSSSPARWAITAPR